jgi:hypothetical protein
MTLIALPAFSDPIRMLHDGHEVIGAPAGAAPVQTAPHAYGLALASILVSHRGPVRDVRHPSLHNNLKERPLGLSARPCALPDESTAQVAQECTPSSRLLPWKNRIR